MVEPINPDEMWGRREPDKATIYQFLAELREFRIILLGVPGTKETGLSGELKEALTLLKKINGMVKSDHAWVGALKWVILLLSAGLLACLTGQIGIW